jgi:hypothetical protein
VAYYTDHFVAGKWLRQHIESAQVQYLCPKPFVGDPRSNNQQGRISNVIQGAENISPGSIQQIALTNDYIKEVRVNHRFRLLPAFTRLQRAREIRQGFTQEMFIFPVLADEQDRPGPAAHPNRIL